MRARTYSPWEPFCSEMVTNRKAFGGHDADQVRQVVTVGLPVAPSQINSKLQPGLSEVIMKALSKSPDQRYQSGLDLVNDLERCKESTQKVAAPRKMPQVAAPCRKTNLPERAEETRPAITRAAAAGAGSSSTGLPSATSSRQWRRPRNLLRSRRSLPSRQAPTEMGPSGPASLTWIRCPR